LKLAALYIQAAFRLYDCNDTTDHEQNHFLKVIQNADLTAPLEKNIYDKATEHYQKWS